MSRRPASRVTSVLAWAALALAGLATLPGTASAAEVSADAGVAAQDFATATWADPWDFSNPQDMLLDNGGPAMALDAATVRDGLLSVSLSRPGYISPLWGGYPGSVYLEREGGAPQNRIDAGRFTRFSFSAYASSSTPAGLFWWNCEGLQSSCQGGQPLSLRAGWHTYDIAVANAGGGFGSRPWAGPITGLRLALSPSSSTQIAFDWMRLYRPNGSVTVDGADTWDVDGDASDNGRAPGSGEMPCAAACDLSFLPPGAYRFVDGGAYTDWVSLRRSAKPVVVDPDAVGGLDYAAADPWDLNSPGDVRAVGNAAVLGYGNRLTARNTSNDPFVWMNLRHGAIDPNRFHRLTVASSYQGPFDLSDSAGGGSHGRVVWQRADQPAGTVVQTKEWVTYSGSSRQTYDLASAGVHEDDAGNKLPWTGAPVTGLRWDPNEDRGGRVWTLDRVALRADDEAGSSFDIRWYDAGYAPGSTATIYRQTDRAGGGRAVIASGVAQNPGTNVLRWDVAGTPAGRYWVVVDVNGPAGVGSGLSSGPVHVRKDFAGQAPSPVTPLTRDLGGACPQSRVPEDGLADAVASVHESAIDCVIWWGVARGTGSGYRPDNPVTREQMATFLAGILERNGVDLPTDPDDAFDDDDGSVHELGINQMAQLGVVAGTGGRRYDPAGQVRREHMATFLVRAYRAASGEDLVEAADYFADVAGSPHQANINKAAAAGIAGGLGEGRYGPLGTVTRGQMAAFVARTLDVLVAAEAGAPPEG
jgi:hypothetical protein